MQLFRKTKMPPVNEELLSYAYEKFHESPNFDITKCTQKQIADNFAKYVFQLQKSLSKYAWDLKLTTKKPMAAMINDSFSVQDVRPQ